ncbi:MAG: polyribonucleotide nucleotidyltransferase [Alphaproteobacteria bacterium]|nr:polyribonucleotide nucleotidyltransferase [Alphaproteobacteria bacterium]
MFDIIRKEIMWGGKKLVLETGHFARQANGAVMVSYGDTRVLCTAVAQKEAKPDIDFFPLTVNYVEKYYAAGKFPGGFFKRESRPSEKETLTSRLIDRPIRPMFHESFRNETQVICTVVSHETDASPDVAAMVGASAALTISGIPFLGPIAGARVGYINGQYVLNPSPAELLESDLDLYVAGTRTSVLMVESEAKELSEEVMLGAVTFGHKNFQPIIDLIISLAEESAKEPWAVNDKMYADELVERIRGMAEAPLREAYALRDKQARTEKLSAAKKAVKEAFATDETVSKSAVGGILKQLEADIVRGDILSTGVRIDGRKTDNVRQIQAEVSVLPRTHGSALFTRGETQALVVTTLGNAQDEQVVDTMEGDSREQFMLHYNFPPFSVGEVGFLRAPGRREIGHGKLAKRALQALIPSKEVFPYTVRVVSEITESNGSSSMASVCGASLAMMDAGVPLERPVAGIAMGLIKEGDKFAVLSDIRGDEDHLGDMDFKVAGTEKGVTALQMDIKINGITTEIMKVALDQANKGRLHILGEMAKAIDGSRGDISPHAPKITSLSIPKDKIREVIGTGGSVIREICEVSGAKVDIEDDGSIYIFAVNKESGDKAEEMIRAIVSEPEMNAIYDGEVVRIVDFGAFVRFMGKTEGLVHVSELADERVEKVTDKVNEGDKVKVMCIDMERGKYRLSMRAVDQKTGADIRDTLSRPISKAPPSKGGRDGGRRDERPRRRQA